MLTVKHIDEFGFERVFPATQVRTRGREYPAAQDVKAQIIDARPNFIVDCIRGPTEAETIRDGQIYVMNENGKTVASYDLRPVVGVKAVRVSGEVSAQRSMSAGVMGRTASVGDFI